MPIDVRKGQGDVKLTREEFERRLRDYPRHLAGRVFTVVVHGDTVGAETLRRSLSDWLADMKLLPAMRKVGLINAQCPMPKAQSPKEVQR